MAFLELVDLQLPHRHHYYGPKYHSYKGNGKKKLEPEFIHWKDFSQKVKYILEKLLGSSNSNLPHTFVFTRPTRTLFCEFQRGDHSLLKAFPYLASDHTIDRCSLWSAASPQSPLPVSPLPPNFLNIGRSQVSVFETIKFLSMHSLGDLMQAHGFKYILTT